MAILIVLQMLAIVAECQLFDLLTPYHQADPYSYPYQGGFLTSYASAIPRPPGNLVAAKTPGSNLPPPEAPQVLLTHLQGRRPVQPPQQTSRLSPTQQSASSPNNFMKSVQDPHHPGTNTIGQSPQHSASQPISGLLHQKGGKGSTIPLTRKMKKMAATIATQLGYKPYYEAHGCVDPTTTLHGQHGRLAGFALMVGCNNRHAQEVCEMAQVAQAGKAGTQMRMVMEYMLPRGMKHQLEGCLTPSTLMTGMANMMTGFMSHQRHGPVPPQGAALPQDGGPPRDCQMVSQMLMMSPSASEGMMSLESMEQIGALRNKYFKMSCQENMLLGTLPYRMCCPGKVPPPSLQEAMMMRGAGGA